MARRTARTALVLALNLGLLGVATTLAGCGGDGDEGTKDQGGIISMSKTNPAGDSAPEDPATIPKPGGPTLSPIVLALPVLEKPDPRSAKLGYLRLGTKVVRGEKPVKFDACRGGYYRVLPAGYVCLDDGATIDQDHPLVKANLKGPDRSKPLPYTYGFVRAIAPRYYRLPTHKEQLQYEMELERHLRSFRRLEDKWNAIEVGSNDVPMDEQGRVLGPAPESPPEMSELEKFGGDSSGAVPWFFDGGRKLPNVSSFKVPDYAIITNRVARHAGLSLIGAMDGDDRRFALTTDLRLVPISKLKPGRGSVFHGIELSDRWKLPMGFVKRDGAYLYERTKGQKKKKTRLAMFTPVQLTGDVRSENGGRMLETQDGDWVRGKDLAIAVEPSSLPKFAKTTSKWIDVSIQQQVLLLYEGQKPVFATMVSTGRDGLGEPGKTFSTPRGTFRIRDKHVTTTMDSDELGSKFELNDVPWVQYFKAGYAIHAAYWHTDYGRPRSHGCINLSPIDAHRIFGWTEPPVPEGWHGVSASETSGEGTVIHIHP